MKKLIAVLLLLLAAGTMAFAWDGVVTVINDTGYDIYYLYISNENSDDWEEDVLGDDVLADGESVRVTITDGESSVYDIQLEDEDGDTYTLWDVDLSDNSEVTITLDDLDEAE